MEQCGGDGAACCCALHPTRTPPNSPSSTPACGTGKFVLHIQIKATLLYGLDLVGYRDSTGRCAQGLHKDLFTYACRCGCTSRCEFSVCAMAITRRIKGESGNPGQNSQPAAHPLSESARGLWPAFCLAFLYYFQLHGRVSVGRTTPPVCSG